MSAPTRPPAMMSAALAIARKDLRVELRTRAALLSAVAFSIVSLTVFYFAWEPGRIAAADVAPGVMWVIFVFSGMLGVQRSFSIEQVDRAIDGLLLAPVDREAIYLGKAMSNALFVGAIQAVSIPAAGLFYNLPLWDVAGRVVSIAALATIGLVSVGTLFAAMVVNTRMAELLLPLLSVPFFMPIVMAAARATAGAINGAPFGETLPYIKLLLAFDLVFVTACTVAYPFTLEE